MTKHYCDFCETEVGERENTVKIGKFVSVYDQNDIIYQNVCKSCVKEIVEFLKDLVSKK